MGSSFGRVFMLVHVDDAGRLHPHDLRVPAFTRISNGSISADTPLCCLALAEHRPKGAVRIRVPVESTCPRPTCVPAHTVCIVEVQTGVIPDLWASASFRRILVHLLTPFPGQIYLRRQRPDWKRRLKRVDTPLDPQ